MIRTIFILAFSVAFALRSSSQIPKCGNDRISTISCLRPEKPDFEHAHRVTGSTESGYIPVFFHIIYSRESENIDQRFIDLQLTELNRAFSGAIGADEEIPAEFRPAVASMDIRFCLQGVSRRFTSKSSIGVDTSLFLDEQGRPTIRNPSRCLNVYVANTGPAIAGFGIYPWASTAIRDGVVIHPSYFGRAPGAVSSNGRTLVHEVGHYLGLLHLWADDTACNFDDGIEDTPPQQHGWYGKPEYPSYSCGTSNQFMNFLDYPDDDAIRMFSKGQAAAIVKNLATFRPELLQAEPCQSEASDAFVIFPNPSRTTIWIRSGGAIAKKCVITLYDAAGRLVVKADRIVDEIPRPITEVALPPGVFIIHVDSHAEKIVIY